METLALLLVVILNIAVLSSGHKHSSPFDFLRHERAKVKIENSIQFSVSPTTLSTSGEWVKVSWQDVKYPNSSDWIGVYSPPANDVYRIDPINHAPIKFQYASHSPTYMSHGYGYLKFRLINMRHPIILGFFRGGFEYPTLVAVSNVVRFQNWNEPLQAHLALTGDPTEMVLQWVTRHAKLPVVYWGNVSQSYDHTKSASTRTYNASYMCGSPATDFGYRNPGLIHQITMDNLTPGMKYYYIFGDNYGWSEEFSFRAAPEKGSSDTISLIAYGDMGCGEQDDSYQMQTEQPSMNTTNLIQEQLDDIDFVMHIGDMSYALGYSSVWDTFFDQIQPIASRVPYMVCIGNHERNWPYSSPGYYNNTDSGGECGVPHEMRFPMPRPALDYPWYAFDYGSAHFLVMSTEHDFRQGSRQYQYLSNELASVDRSITPWLIFAGHRPMYVASTDEDWPDGHLPVAESLQESLEPLFNEYKVDLAMWAHHHSYQRTCPVYQQNCTEGGTTHVVIGMGGRDLSTDLIPDETPEWIEFVDYHNYGYSKLTANATTLVFEFIRDADNEVHDMLVLEN